MGINFVLIITDISPYSCSYDSLYSIYVGINNHRFHSNRTNLLELPLTNSVSVEYNSLRLEASGLIELYQQVSYHSG